jgi:mono/diheme cytochrome c family protein
MIKIAAFTASLALAISGTAALAAPDSYVLPEPTAQLRAPLDASHAAGFQAAQESCQTCHSPDYVAMQPPRKGQAFWTSEVTKMVKVYHAPIEEAQAKAIAAYLDAAY